MRTGVMAGGLLVGFCEEQAPVTRYLVGVLPAEHSGVGWRTYKMASSKGWPTPY